MTWRGREKPLCLWLINGENCSPWFILHHGKRNYAFYDPWIFMTDLLILGKQRNAYLKFRKTKGKAKKYFLRPVKIWKAVWRIFQAAHTHSAECIWCSFALVLHSNYKCTLFFPPKQAFLWPGFTLFSLYAPHRTPF